MSLNLSLDEIWAHTIKCFEIITNKATQPLDVHYFKMNYIHSHNLKRTPYHCLFCAYTMDKFGRKNCDKCPARLVDPTFDCTDVRYHYMNKPKAFYRKLLFLNQLRINQLKNTTKSIDKETRPSKIEIHMRTALLWAERALCKRDNRKVGCVITSQDLRHILGIGYNAPPKNMPHDACRNIPGDCGCLHAEQNAIAVCDGRIPNKVIFITMEPCERCANLIAQANISKVYYEGSTVYTNHKGLERLTSCNIPAIKMIINHKGSIIYW